ncbi:MAG: hypothetical protein IJ673_07575 [Treponema sp.]|nr:hypothetical protein [Treponema sp.]
MKKIFTMAAILFFACIGQNWAQDSDYVAPRVSFSSSTKTAATAEKNVEVQVVGDEIRLKIFFTITKGAFVPTSITNYTPARGNGVERLLSIEKTPLTSTSKISKSKNKGVRYCAIWKISGPCTTSPFDMLIESSTDDSNGWENAVYVPIDGKEYFPVYTVTKEQILAAQKAASSKPKTPTISGTKVKK